MTLIKKAKPDEEEAPFDRAAALQRMNKQQKEDEDVDMLALMEHVKHDMTTTDWFGGAEQQGDEKHGDGEDQAAEASVLSEEEIEIHAEEMMENLLEAMLDEEDVAIFSQQELDEMDDNAITPLPGAGAGAGINQAYMNDVWNE